MSLSLLHLDVSKLKLWILACALAVALEGQDFNEALTRGSQALEKGACKDAANLVGPALENALRRVGKVDPAQEVRAAILVTDARVCVGFYDEALQLANELKSRLPSGSPDLIAPIQFLRAEAEKGKGLYAEADADYAAAAEIKVTASPEMERWSGRILTGWAELSRLRGDFAKSDAQLKNAFAILNKGPRDSAERAYALLVAGDLARNREVFAEARDRYNEARSIAEAKSKEHPVAARASLGLGLIELAIGKLTASEIELKRAEAASRRTTSSDAYLQTSSALGLLDLAKGNLRSAEGNLGATLETELRSRGDQHPETARCRDDLGMLFLIQNKPDSAVEELKKAETIQRRVLGPEHPDLAMTLDHLGRAYRMQHKLAEAKEVLDQALRIQVSKLGRNSLARATTLVEQGRVLFEQNSFSEAEGLYRDALSTQDSLMAKDSLPRLATIRELALALHRGGKNVAAELLIQEWMRARGQSLAVLDPERLPLAMAQAEISLGDHKFPQAEKQFTEILSANEKLGKAAQQMYRSEKGLADALFGQQKWKESARHYETALPNMGDEPGVFHAWVNLAACYSTQKQWTESARVSRLALDKARTAGAPESERQAILLALLQTSAESGQTNQLSTYVTEWLSANAKRAAPLATEEIKTLETVAQKLLAAQQYSKAEPVLRLLTGDGHGTALRGVNVNQALTELAEACAAQNKNREASDLYERLASRMTAVRRLSDAEQFLLKAKGLREKDKDTGLSAISTIQALANTYVLDHKYAEARPLFEQAAILLKQRAGADDPRNAVNLDGLGMIAEAEKNYELAGALFDQAYTLLSKTAKPSEGVLASVLFHIGSLKMSIGKFSEANQAFERSIQLVNANYKQDDAPPVDEFDQIASAFVRQERFAEAEKLYKDNLALRRQFFGANSLDEGWGLDSLAVFYNSRKMYDKAADAGERALRIFEATAGPDSDEASMALAQLATVYQSEGDMDKAIAATARSAEIQAKLGRPRSEVTVTLSTLGEYYRSSKHYDSALKTYLKLAELWQKESFSNPNYQMAARNLAITYLYLKDFNNSQDWYHRLFAALQDPGQKAKFAESYADALRMNGRVREARKVMDQARSQAQQHR